MRSSERPCESTPARPFLGQTNPGIDQHVRCSNTPRLRQCRIVAAEKQYRIETIDSDTKTTDYESDFSEDDSASSYQPGDYSSDDSTYQYDIPTIKAKTKLRRAAKVGGKKPDNGLRGRWFASTTGTGKHM